MHNSHRFFCNRECRYFPCHRTSRPDEFNCLFCFCPLYFLDDCGGNFTVLESGVKDCTACMVPHTPKGYDHILTRLKERFDAIRKSADAGPDAEQKTRGEEAARDGVKGP
ncbi:MAG: cysteine-rich small domain-containing protein [Pseudodesulfovibrio sp.]|nr:cysteine-rich small domain-containing protein [Pseudodesulfovibrio sp.]MBU4190758.1 cysteine-rich small domain-containing protein [Pseudomonadota bacterium]MCG2732670.1 cysteine-rich small domain-containing protein [Pseudodesulfovibrio aespoeensis]MBU4379301.1 cysteine-rich small domain-containing protein [Pseudomonadota bacterium]MBU4475817.1 cysteine-rich small domain-containing protein [Pseudomonadota bacterium]MBU4515800.1 cysteine-rich small domain-containing protein [Pseudomonadota ba